MPTAREKRERLRALKGRQREEVRDQRSRHRDELAQFRDRVARMREQLRGMSEEQRALAAARLAKEKEEMMLRHSKAKLDLASKHERQLESLIRGLGN